MNTPARFIIGLAATIAVIGGALGVANAASATEPEVDATPYVLVLWVSDADHPDLWPQSLVATADLAEPNLSALDGEFPDCGVVQVDLYWDNEVTAALVAGGVLYGPGNPPEALAYVLNGADPWKVVDLGECIPVPPKPEPIVVVTDEVVTDCEADTVTTFVTTTTTDWTLVDNVWVEAEPVAVVTSTSVPADDEQCPPPVVTETPVALASTGSLIGDQGTHFALALALLLAGAAALAALRITRKQ